MKTYRLGNSNTYFDISGDEGNLTLTITGVGDTGKHHPYWSILDIKNLVVTYGVTGIGDSFFSSCKFESILLPESLIRIGKYAFCHCNSLKSIIIPDSVTFIEKGAFHGCTNLLSISLPKSLRRIEDDMFEYCVNLEKIIIPDSVEHIGVGAFSCCKKLDNIILPNSLEILNLGVFQECDNLTSIELQNSIKTIKSFAFEMCFNLKSIILPSSLEFIERNSFYHSGIESIIIPNKITEINVETFAGCSNLSSITIEGSIDIIKPGAFGGCSNLRDIFLLSATPPICEKDSFGDNDYSYYRAIDKSLCTVHVPKGCKDKYSKSIYWADFPNIKDDVPEVIQNINITEENTGILSKSNDCEEKYLNYKLLGSEDNLTLIIEGNLSMLYYYDRSNAPWYKEISDSSSIKHIIIEEGISSIGYEIFSWLKNLVSVHIPETVIIIEESAFASCYNLKTVIIPNSVTNIGKYAFSDCINLETVVMSDSIIEIGEGAFKRCHRLKSINLPNSLKYISRDTFNECCELIDIILPDSIEFIGDRAFCGCKKLKNLIIPNSVSSIGGSAFSGCKNLSNLFIPDSVEEIEENAFNGCESLTSIVLPNSIKDLYNIFPCCKKLSEIIIPNSVIRIHRNSFSHLENLKEIIIPESVCKIDEYFFYNTGLLNIYVNKNKPMIGLTKIEMDKTNCVLHVPFAQKYNYEQAFILKDFKNIKDDIRGPIELETPYIFYELKGEISDLTLIISGVGGIMAERKFYKYPWRDYDIKTLIIEQGIAELDKMVFFYNDFANIYVYTSNPPVCSENAFNQSTTNCILHIPSGSKNKYEQSIGWMNFKNIIEY